MAVCNKIIEGTSSRPQKLANKYLEFSNADKPAPPKVPFQIEKTAVTRGFINCLG